MSLTRVVRFLLISIVATVVIFSAGYIDYLMNIEFILENLNALPFRYQVALAFYNCEPLAIVTSVAGGLIWGFVLDKRRG